MMRWILASVHLLALGIGLGSIWVRARALRAPHDAAAVRRVLAADTVWGVAAALWIATGLARALGPFEKGSAYYFSNPVFWIKMGIFVLVFALEIAPMLAFIGWRKSLARGLPVDTSRAALFARTSEVQAILIVAMVFAATAMARGLIP